MEGSGRALRIFYLCYEFPVLTQTFTIREIEGLRREGLPVTVFSCRPPRRRGGPESTVLPRPLSGRALAALLRYALRRPVVLLSLLLRIALARYRDEPVRCWLRGFRQLLSGAALARRVEAEEPRPHLHAQFVDYASTVAWVAAALARTTFSVTNHTAYNPYLLRPKLRAAALFVSISEFDRALTLRMAGRRDAPNLRVIRQGVDLAEFPFREPRPPGDPAKILSVGALREKKGHQVLLRAAARLRDRGRAFRLTIVGEGPMRPVLEEMISRGGLAPLVTLAGAEPPDRVRERLREADLFVLACVVARNGDLDGIPVSLLEAMAAGVPVVSTRLSGIPEAVEAEALVAPGDAVGLAEKMEEILADPERAAGSVRRARERVEREYDLRKNVAALAAQLRVAAG